jgi:rhamnogalacturonan endolyase
MAFSPLYGAEVGVVVKLPDNPTTLSETQRLIDAAPTMLRQMEELNRGLVAIQTENGVFLSWRWLGTEAGSTTYHVYRDGKRITSSPLNLTNFVDTLGTSTSSYQVIAVADGKEGAKSAASKVLKENVLSIPISAPPSGEIEGDTYTYFANDASTADLTGDGNYEIILQWEPSNAKDSAHTGFTGPTYLDAYTLTGTRLWRINVGPNVRAGAHDTQFLAYDFDGDGKAEVAFKTADGTIDGKGNVIGDPTANWAALDNGKNLQGPLYVSIFDGVTGQVLDTIPYDPQTTDYGTEAFGDNWGNRSERYLAGVAYLDGMSPSMVFARGYYKGTAGPFGGRTVIATYDFKDGQLAHRWVFDTVDYDNQYIGQGNHSLAVADVDFDGKDEIIYGALVINDDGTPLYSTGLGHGDAQHTGDLIPSRPGLEIFSVHEEKEAAYGLEMRDARTGEIIFGSFEGRDVGRGVSADIDPRFPGAESWASGKLINSNGEVIATNPTLPANFLVYWDKDLGREVQDSIYISKWNPNTNKVQTIFTAKDGVSINGTKANPSLTADLFGDWREEVVYPSKDGKELLIYTTTEPTPYKIYTLMHDSHYRTYIATQNTAYNQPAHTGYYLGFDTTSIPVPKIFTTDGHATKVNPDLQLGTWSIDSLYTGLNAIFSLDEAKGIYNQEVVRLSNTEKAVTPYPKNDTIYVPLEFATTILETDLAYNDDLFVVTFKGYSFEVSFVEEVPFVPLSRLLEVSEALSIWELDGFFFVSDKTPTFTQAQKAELLAQLKQAPLPAVKEPQPIIPVSLLAENQLPIYGVKASDHDGNAPEGAVDGDMNTRWSAHGPNTLTLDLGKEVEISGVMIAMWKGHERTTPFLVETSLDGKTWTTALPKTSNSQTTESAETYLFPSAVIARYVRYNGDGDTMEGRNYCHISEIAILP